MTKPKAQASAILAKLDEPHHEPPPIPVAEYLEAALTPRHALETSPANSKIVVVLMDGKSHAVLATPAGAHELPVGDAAHRLPEGARIRKLEEGRYVAEQMSPVEDHPPLVTDSVDAAIGGFIAHFHPTGLAR